MFYPHFGHEMERKETLVEHAAIAKKYLQKIPSKKDFDDLIDQVPLSPTEYQIIVKKFKKFRSVIQIASELYISTSTVYNYQRSGLVKVYYFLEYRKCI
ncbi:MAG: hypothetical protein K2N51_16910 [Lachnospiraceae bacterium]|nr:hypothetical protein [Lachnospiraceae bacterium]